MHTRQFSLLPLALVFISGMGCTHKEDLPSISSAVGSYTIAGRAVKCQVKAHDGYALTRTDSLRIVSLSLADASQPADKSSTLLLDYYKSATQPNAAYELSVAIYLPGRDSAAVVFEHVAGTLTETSPGIFTGTFADTQLENPPITRGSFAGVRIDNASE